MFKVLRLNLLILKQKFENNYNLTLTRCKQVSLSGSHLRIYTALELVDMQSLSLFVQCETFISVLEEYTQSSTLLVIALIF